MTVAVRRNVAQRRRHDPDAIAILAFWPTGRREMVDSRQPIAWRMAALRTFEHATAAVCRRPRKPAAINATPQILPFGNKRLVPYAGRGQIYSWLRAHHDEVAARLAAEEIT